MDFVYKFDKNKSYVNNLVNVLLTNQRKKTLRILNFLLPSFVLLTNHPIPAIIPSICPPPLLSLPVCTRWVSLKGFYHGMQKGREEAEEMITFCLIIIALYCGYKFLDAIGWIVR